MITVTWSTFRPFFKTNKLNVTFLFRLILCIYFYLIKFKYFQLFTLLIKCVSIIHVERSN